MKFPACAYLALDSGTTNTRIWLMKGGRVLARTQVAAGVRDTARTGSRSHLQDEIRRGIHGLLEESSESPRFALAAGMITSPLGLVNLPHVEAPAGPQELAQGVALVSPEGLPDWPVYFVRGVRSGPGDYGLEQAPSVDLIRGEETEIMGTLQRGSSRGPLLYIHLGSHTKAILVSEHGSIEAGTTTLSGELMDAVRSRTILSEPLRAEVILEEKGVLAGSDWVRRFGFSRSLFLIRVLSQSPRTSAAELGSVFAGALVEEDLTAIRARGFLPAPAVLISGLPGLHPAWDWMLGREGVSPVFLTPEETEENFLTGLQHIVFSSPAYAHSQASGLS